MDNIADLEEPKIMNSSAVNCIVMLYANIEAAQNSKGGLTFNDCEALQNARNNLLKLFTTHDGADAKNSLEVFVKTCHHFQALGAFSIEGSCRIHANITLLAEEVGKLTG